MNNTKNIKIVKKESNIDTNTETALLQSSYLKKILSQENVSYLPKPETVFYEPKKSIYQLLLKITIMFSFSRSNPQSKPKRLSRSIRKLARCGRRGPLEVPPSDGLKHQPALLQGAKRPPS